MNDKLAQIKQTINATASPDLPQIRDWIVQLEVFGNGLTQSQKQHDVLATLLTANDSSQTNNQRVTTLMKAIDDFTNLLESGD